MSWTVMPVPVSPFMMAQGIGAAPRTSAGGRWRLTVPRGGRSRNAPRNKAPVGHDDEDVGVEGADLLEKGGALQGLRLEHRRVDVAGAEAAGRRDGGRGAAPPPGRGW